ncbi:MAG: hypothetical protein Q7K65_03565 [Candidatus Buchananbacteria bacterium]|nr:hypothetical protein [Candidatus Buchananbacteria bacterium]
MKRDYFTDIILLFFISTTSLILCGISGSPFWGVISIGFLIIGIKYDELYKNKELLKKLEELKAILEKNQTPQ